MTSATRLRLSVSAAAAATLLAALPAAAEIELKLFTGTQSAPHSRIKGDYGNDSEGDPIGSFDNLIGWDGKSFEAPPYYGVRGTWWMNEAWGFGVEFTHNKVYSRSADREAAGFSHLEFTDGLNILTVNATRRWQDQWGSLTPYLGGGVGVAFPHVETDVIGGASTRGYQLTGPAVRLTAGMDYELTERWSVFGEYQFTASWNDADLDDEGSLSTRIYTNALNVGVGFRF